MYIKELENYKEYVEHQNGRSGMMLNSNTIFDDLSKSNIEIKKDSYILDIGCRAGAYTVRGFIDRGYKNTYGIDIGKNAENHWVNYSCYNHLKLFDIHEGNPFDYKWDFISISHTLEHLYDPKKVLESLYTFMNKDGLIHSIVPMETSIDHFQRHHPHMVMFENHEEHIKFYKNSKFEIKYEALEKNENSILIAKKIS